MLLHDDHSLVVVNYYCCTSLIFSVNRYKLKLQTTSQHTECTVENRGVVELNARHECGVLFVTPSNASASAQLCPGSPRGTLFTQDEEEEGHIGALLNHY